MSKTTKFLSFLSFSSGPEIPTKENLLFDALIESVNLTAVNKMLEAGFVPNLVNFKNYINFIERVSPTQIEESRQRVINSVGLMLEAMTRGQEKGIKYFSEDYANLKSQPSDFEISGRLQPVVNFFKYCTNMDAFNEMDVIDKIKFKSNLENVLFELKYKWPFHDVVNENDSVKNLLPAMEQSVESGLNVILSSISTREQNNLASKRLNKIIQNNIDPVVAKRISDLESAVAQFYLTNSNIDVQDKILIDRIIEEDIPKLISGTALLPVDIQGEYKNAQGLSVKEALNSLIEKYEATISGIIGKVTIDAANQVHKEMEINTRYINKVRQASGAPAFDKDDIDLNSDSNSVKAIKIA